MKIPFLDLKTQYFAIKPEIDDAINKVIKKTAFIGGKAVNDFCDNFSSYIGTKYCIPVGNGTDALLIALKALGVGKGDEVITAANSFVATSEAITAAGARVVFVDCDPDTYSIDVNKIAAKITNKTKVIIPVHLYGQPADMDNVMRIASKYNLKVLEDCAQAHGALYKGKRVGTFGQISSFSFYPGKNLGAYGDGGIILSNSGELARFCKMYANHGRIEKYNHEFEGMNSRLDGLQAAVLNVKLKYLDDWNEQRRNVAKLYRQYLSNVDNIILPVELEYTKPVYHLFVIRAEQRDKLQIYLKKSGISTGIHYPIGLPFLKAYKYLNHKSNDFPVTYKYQNKILSLPIFPEMTDEMVHYVVEKIKEFVN